MVKNKKLLIGIIGGKGHMGSLFAKLFKKSGYEVIISDLGTKLRNKDIAKKADIIIVSVPIDKTKTVINEIISFVKKDSLLMDLTSIKKEPISEMLKSKASVIGLHPMFNDTSFGKNQKVIICPARPNNWLTWVKIFFKQNELQYYIMTPQEHDDKIMPITQALVHFAEISFAKTLQSLGLKVEEAIKYAGPASELKIEMASRILAQSANLYGNIQVQNPENIKILEEYIKETNNLFEIVKSKNLKEFENYFKKSAKFLGEYKEKAMEETDWIIAQLLEKNKRKMQASGLYIDSRLIDKNIKKVKKGDIGILGPRLTYSDLATDKWLKFAKKDNLSRNYYKNINNVLKAVKKRNVKIGIVPIEAKLDGVIRETLDGLFENDLRIIQELSIPIHHSLVVLPSAKKEDIVAVMSRPQAISACGKFLKKHFPKVEKINFTSTVAAMEKLINEKHKNIAVIGSKKAAQNLGLKILAENIEDFKENRTTFIIVTKEKTKINFKTGKNQKTKTSIAFYFGKDKPGNLSAVINEFSINNINLTRIESRPSQKSYGDYIFFLDFDGSLKEPRIKKTLNNIKQKVAKLKFLGSYSILK